MGFIHYMASQDGRALRITAGALLIVLAAAGLHGVAAAVLAVVGVVFILVGLFDVCLLAPLFGKSFRGSDIRG